MTANIHMIFLNNRFNNLTHLLSWKCSDTTGYLLPLRLPLVAVLFFLAPSLPIIATASSSLSSVDSRDSSPSEPEETVTIDGITYPVPQAWIGQKLDVPPLRTPALIQIPQELTQDQSSIYILQEACEALVAMATKAKEDGISLVVDSGYRSARYQRIIFSRLIKKGHTFEKLARDIAPPSYSEHMLGTVVDFSPGDWRFADTPAYAWLNEHAGEYGFSESYPKNNPDHPWESWHWRYRITKKTLQDKEDHTD